MYLHPPRRLALALIGALVGGMPIASAGGLTPKSPEVLAAAAKDRVPGICCGGERRPDRSASPHRIDALDADRQDGPSPHSRVPDNIRKALGDRKEGPGGAYGHWEGPIYSAGLAIVFLVQLDGYKSNGPHHDDIVTLLEYLHSQQKGHGGWGYAEKTSGDTSMTQYGVLSAWEAKQAGFSVSAESLERAANWLLPTQDPGGGYGYQGELGELAKLVPQSDVKHSMTAAGLGSLFICDHFFKLTARARKPPKAADLPPGLKEIKPDKGPQKPKPRIDPQLVQDAEDRGNGWFDANFKVEIPTYGYYYLYAYEKYRTFRDKVEVEHAVDQNPQWYSDAAEYLLSKQKEDGRGEPRESTTAERRPTRRLLSFLVAQHANHLHGPGDASRRHDGGRPHHPQGHRRCAPIRWQRYATRWKTKRSRTPIGWPICWHRCRTNALACSRPSRWRRSAGWWAISGPQCGWRRCRHCAACRVIWTTCRC